MKGTVQRNTQKQEGKCSSLDAICMKYIFKRSDLNKTHSNKQELSWAMFFPMKITRGRTMMSEMPTLANPE